MTEHTIHPKLPSGFHFANELQAEAFNLTGSIHGASKVCLVRQGDDQVAVALRFRPPFDLEQVKSFLGKRDAASVQEYREDYELGWRNADLDCDMPGGSFAHDDGYLDRAAGRAKWHLTYCANHDDCGEN